MGAADGREGRYYRGDGGTAPSQPGEDEDGTGDSVQVPQLTRTRGQHIQQIRKLLPSRRRYL